MLVKVGPIYGVRTIRDGEVPNMEYRRVALPPGTIIGVRFGLIEHVGIVTDRSIDGVPAVISNSHAHRGAREEPLSSFIQGRSFRVHKALSDRPGEEVADRARRMVGRRYDVLRFNCEHFVRIAHGLKPRSPQVYRAMAVAAGALAVWRLAR